jgi:hypothetical protein
VNSGRSAARRMARRLASLRLLDNVSPMEIDELRWLKIEGFASVKDRVAPKAVVVALASVIGDAGSLASWASWDCTESTTTWSCWIVTERALGHVNIAYGRTLYDQGEEQQHQLEPSSHSAWVRPLAHVTGLRFGHFYAANVTTYYPAEPITVTFPDAETTIPGPNFPVEQRPAADRFLTALRAGVDLPTYSSMSAPS